MQMTTARRTLAVETDTRLADLYGKAAVVRERIARNATTIKQYAGARHTGRGYTMTLAEAEAIISAEGFIPGISVAWWGRPGGDIDRAHENIAQARAELAAIDADIDFCDDVWRANGCWARFFLVPGGHIHRSMDCSTCNNGREPTAFGWLPDLSGLTESDAVAAHGALLCTVCYPSAPAEWTNGLDLAAAAKKAAECPGSRTFVATAKWNARYATCPQCGTSQSRTSTGKLRAHKAAKS